MKNFVVPPILMGMGKGIFLLYREISWFIVSEGRIAIFNISINYTHCAFRLHYHFFPHKFHVCLCTHTTVLRRV